MKGKPLPPPVPRPLPETVRHAIAELLRRSTLGAREISGLVRIPEKEVYGHLEHIRRSIQTGGGFLEITPARCRFCGFVFAKRDRLTPPGKCPVCRHEAIEEPLFRLRQRGERHDSRHPADDGEAAGAGAGGGEESPA
jgi:hypothetical protein